MNISFIKRTIFFMLLYPVIVSGVNITFQVDMTNESVSPDCPPTISGSFFSNWSWFQPLNQIDDAIWAATLELNAGEYHEYKFGNCEWNLESLPEGGPCTNTNYGYTNRFITVPDENITLEPVVYGTCENSEGSGDSNTIRSPCSGCSKPNREACRNGRPRPRSEWFPE